MKKNESDTATIADVLLITQTKIEEHNEKAIKQAEQRCKEQSDHRQSTCTAYRMFEKEDNVREFFRTVQSIKAHFEEHSKRDAENLEKEKERKLVLEKKERRLFWIATVIVTILCSRNLLELISYLRG